MIDLLLFAIFPYVATVVAIVVGILRFTVDRFSYSSLSSQFLEGRGLFWGSVPWHYGIGLILIGHLIGVLFPAQLIAFVGASTRLFIVEGTALALGIMALVGLVILVFRRGSVARVRAVTSRMDVVLLALLLVQVVAGIGIAVLHRWGSFWYAQVAAPYIVSLLTLNPDIAAMSALPLLVKLHVVNAFVLIALLPFTRLVHFLSLPIPYLWRPYQVVIWNRLLKGS